jgi:sialate O-acetylesterase
LIGDHMVLQREKPLPIWGWAEAGEEVTVKLDETQAVAKADAQGHWQVTLAAMKADGKPHHMTISGKNKIEIDDILIGEVWIGSGQSNMEFGLAGSTTAKEAIAAADRPQIRLLHVKKVQSKEPAKDIVIHSDARVAKNAPPPPPETGPAWKVCTPTSVPGFSAVLYYFGVRLQKELNVPIGLINSSWGGSPIEAWLPKTGGMYNAMIAPLQPFAIRGVLWYQGESNVLKADTSAYFDKQKSLIEGWQQGFGQEFSFYEVQIAPWEGRYEPGRLPILWECQVETLKLPHTGMAVTTDLVDNIKDIHPRNKIDVGNRLALWALAKDYKKDVIYSGPLYKSMKVEGSKIRLSFAHVGGGLKARDGKPLSEFEIAGADGKFVPAEATIDGASIIVASKEVTTPTQVRFGWRNIANPNLINSEGLPASPFQTNNWKGGTGE